MALRFRRRGIFRGNANQVLDATHEYPALRKGRAGEDLFAERGTGEFLEFARGLDCDERAFVRDEHQPVAGDAGRGVARFVEIVLPLFAPVLRVVAGQHAGGVEDEDQFAVAHGAGHVGDAVFGDPAEVRFRHVARAVRADGLQLVRRADDEERAGREKSATA